MKTKEQLFYERRSRLTQQELRDNYPSCFKPLKEYKPLNKQS